MNEVPLVYAFFYKKIKEKNRSHIIRTSFLKECIGRIVVRAQIPRYFIYDIIKDMQKMQLIQRIDHTKYEILDNNCEKKLKKFIW